jgi:hypothetical protein
MDRRQAERSGARRWDIRVSVLCSAPSGARQASRSSRRRATEDLGGEQSPWKDRALSGLKWPGNVTDSSAEQGPEVGHSTEAHRSETASGLRRRSWDAIREGRRARVQRRSSSTSVGGGGLPGDGSALLLNGTLGRSGLRSRGTTPIRCAQATSNRDLDAEDRRFIRWSHPGGRSCVARHPRPGSRRVEGMSW